MILSKQEDIRTKLKFEGYEQVEFTIKYIGNAAHLQSSNGNGAKKTGIEDFASDIIVDWSGIKADDASELPCNDYNIRRFLLTEVGMKMYYHIFTICTNDITEFLGIKESMADLKPLRAGRVISDQ